MRRDPMPIAHTITYERWNRAESKYISDAEIRSRKKWCFERFGAPGQRATWWNETNNNYFRLHFSNMEDVTIFLLVWDK